MNSLGKYTVIFICCFLFLVPGSQSQVLNIIGILQNKLVEIDKELGIASFYRNIENLGEEDDLVDLTYHSGLSLYFSILNPSNSPQLVSISIDGEYDIIGPITYNNNQIQLVEAIAYYAIENKLFVGVSLNGGVSGGDYYSETLMEIDPATGACSLVGELSTNHVFPDIDVMAFQGEYLYLFDGGPPNANFSTFYKIGYSNINQIFSPQIVYETSYIPIRDFTCDGDKIYFVEENKLYFLSLSNASLNFVGQTHSLGDYNGDIIQGISMLERCVPPQPIFKGDTVICDGQSLTYEVNKSNVEIVWQDGTRNPIYHIENPGIYWVQISNECGSIRDTLNVKKKNLPEVSLGQDTIICDNQTYEISIEPGDADIFWQDNQTTSRYEVSKDGIYWVTLSNICGISSDTIEINFKIKPNRRWGSDTILCVGQYFNLNLDDFEGSYYWQNGDTNSFQTINKPGIYWVDIVNECGSIRDSLNVVQKSVQDFNLGNDTIICSEHVYELSLNVNEAIINWQDGQTTSKYKVSESGIYWVTLTNLCGISSDTVSVTFKSSPNVNLGSDTTLCAGQKITINMDPTEGRFRWQNGDTSSIQNITKPGMYWVKVENSCGIKSDTIEVKMIDVSDPIIPNVFTPNSDGINDFFEIDERLKGSSIRFFQRNGSVVYQDNHYENNWNGDNLPSTIYYYLIHDFCGNYYKGWVNILH